MYAFSPKAARTAATRLLVATAATATVCTYCSGLGPPPVRATAAIVNTASIDDSASTIGIADSDLYGMSEADIDTTLDTLQSIGVTSIRILVPWALVEPTDGTYNWTYLDEVVAAAAARNMGVLADVTSTPTWEGSSNSIIGAGAPNPTDYASFLTQVATRYGTNISSYEIWNEPNYMLSYDPIDAASYTELLKAAYTALKAVDSNLTVIAAGLGAGYTLGSLTENPVTFVQEMLADGAAGYFDALSFHPYQETLQLSDGGTVANSPLEQLNDIEALLVAAGLSNTKIWITEYGLPTTDVSQTTQANFIQDLIDTWETLTYAGPVFIYTAQDGTSTDPTGTYGLYEADWTPKLAVAVLAAEIAKYAVSTVVSTVVTPLAALAQQIATLVQSVSQAITNIGQQITAFAQSVGQALAQVGQTIANAVNQVLSTLSAAITNVTKTSSASTQVVSNAEKVVADSVSAATTTDVKTTASTPAVQAAVTAEAPAEVAATTPSTATPSTATPSTATPSASVEAAATADVKTTASTPAVEAAATTEVAATTPSTATPSTATPSTATPSTASPSTSDEAVASAPTAAAATSAAADDTSKGGSQGTSSRHGAPHGTATDGTDAKPTAVDHTGTDHTGTDHTGTEHTDADHVPAHGTGLGTHDGTHTAHDDTSGTSEHEAKAASAANE